jgi:hypothetical protein
VAPVHFAILVDPVVRVPVATDLFWIGRDVACDLCLWDLRVSRHHAKLTRVMGEYALAAEGRHGVFVNGAKTPVIHLRDRDEVVLTPPDAHAPVRLRFENALEGMFVPPSTPLTAAWLASDRSNPAHEGALSRFDVVPPKGNGNGVARPGQSLKARDRETGRDVLLDVLSPVGHAAVEGDRFLRVATAIAGAAHPALARVLEAGVSPAADGGFLRWYALDEPSGRRAAERIAEGPQATVTVVRRLRSLCGAIHLLHERGVAHGSVHPFHVRLRTDGRAILGSFARARLLREGPLETPPCDTGAAWTAPEVVAGAPPTAASDLFGLAALGYAMLTGTPPPAVPHPPPPSATSPDVPGAIDHLLLRGLSSDPSERPTAEDFGQVLAFAEGSLKTASSE